MNRVIRLLSLLTAALLVFACGQKPKAPKVLVLYYSQTANTRTVAEAIQSRLGADIEEIVVTKPYDGDFQQTIERCQQERADGILPEIQPLGKDLSQYDIIFLGYPVWFGTYAPPVAALLDQVDLSGKKVVPFCTFGSGGLSSSAADLARKQPGAEVLPGYGVRAARIDAVADEVERFLTQNGYVEGVVVELEEFPEAQAVTDEETAIFDAAVGDYPMMHAKATTVASRAIPGGREYLFTAVEAPREDGPRPGPKGDAPKFGPKGDAPKDMPKFEPREMKVYITVLDGQAPEFTQVVR